MITIKSKSLIQVNFTSLNKIFILKVQKLINGYEDGNAKLKIKKLNH